MPRARKHIDCLSETPFYHVTSRCVRRAFLCGEDRVTGKSYEHRRKWIEDRIRALSPIFAVEICAYAVMSNHYLLVVRLYPDEVGDWSDDDVVGRWTVAVCASPSLLSVEDCACPSCLIRTELKDSHSDVAHPDP